MPFNIVFSISIQVSYDTAGSYLLLDGNNGSICYISRWGETLKRALKSMLLLFFNDDNHVTFIAFIHSYIHSCVTLDKIYK